MHTFIGDHYPLAAPASAFPFPDDCAVVVAGAAGDRGDQRVRPCGEAIQLDHPERRAPNLRGWRVENQMPLL